MRYFLTLALILLAPSANAQRLWVVDSGGGPGDHSRIGDAVAAASDGDVLLLRPGVYVEEIEIRAKALTLLAETRGTVWLETVSAPNVVRVLDLDADQVVAFRNIEFLAGVRVHGNAGHVLFQGCSSYIARVRDTASATFVDCEIDPLLKVNDSLVAVYDSTITGAVSYFASSAGGTAIEMKGGELLLFGSSVTGGTGAAYTNGCDAGPGGVGLLLVQGATAPLVRTLDSAIAGGVSGADPMCPPTTAAATEIYAGSIVPLSGQPRRTESSVLTHEGSVIRISLAGSPGDSSLAAVSSGVGPSFLPLYQSYGILGVPLFVFFQAGLPSGSLVRQFGLAEAGAGVQGRRYFVQSAFAEPSGVTALSSPSVVVVADLRDPALGTDCDGDGTNDVWALLSREVEDRDRDGVPDVCDPPSSMHVDDDAAGDPAPGDPSISDPLEDGSRLHPFDSLQEAVDAVAVGGPYTVIDIEPGVYRGIGNRDVDLRGKQLTLRGVAGASQTVIDCERAGRAFFLVSGEAWGTRLEDLTIRNGSASLGGGIYAEHGAFTAVRCVFEGNDAIKGGGILSLGPLRVLECSFVSNAATSSSGGGIALYDQSGSLGPFIEAASLISGCRFEGNVAAGGGGGIHVGRQLLGPVRIDRCVFRENQAGTGGGGALLDELNYRNRLEGCSVTNSLFERNQAGAGGAIYAGPWLIRNCTITENAAAGGGGILAKDTRLESSILWANTSTTPGQGDQLYVPWSGGPGTTAAFCDVQGGAAGVTIGFGATYVEGPGNLDVDPEFLDPASGNFRLPLTSPCVGAGDPEFVSELVETDFEGRARMDGFIDMGAFESGP